VSNARILSRLAAMPRSAQMLTFLVIVLAGFFLPGIAGALALAIVVIVLGWLLTLTWSTSTPGLRVMRLVVLAALVGFALWKVFSH
jgi:hypothetical protein